MQLALFVIALFAVPWFWGTLLPPTSPTLSGILASLLPSVWAPTLLALVFMSARGRREASSELRELLAMPAPSATTAAAVILPAGSVALAVGISRAVGDGAPFVTAAALPIAVGLQLITGAVGEELGWRGVLLSRAAPLVGQVPAAWGMGVLWALWHVPAFFTPGMPHQSMPLASTLLAIAPFGAFMAFLFFRAGQSIWVTIAAHLSLNIATALGGVTLSSTVFWRTQAVVFWIAALAMTVTEGTATARQPAHT